MYTPAIVPYDRLVSKASVSAQVGLWSKLIWKNLRFPLDKRTCVRYNKVIRTNIRFIRGSRARRQL